MPSKKYSLFKKLFYFIGPPLPLSKFRAGMHMGKKRWLLQENCKREKKELF